MIVFLREKIFKKNKNKAYCIQMNIDKLQYFLWAIFDLKVVLLDDRHYFGFYFTLFGSFLNIRISWTRKCDHAGPDFDIDFLWFGLHLSIYDTRHWDDDTDAFKIYD